MFECWSRKLEQLMLDIVMALVSHIAVILAVHRANNVRYKVHVLLYW